MSATLKLGLMVLALLAWSAAAQAAGETTVTKTESAEVTVTATPARLGDAYASTTKGPYYYENEYELKARKFARGFVNVGMCWAEIPNQMFREAYRSSPISGGLVGVWKGVVKGSKRFAIGTWEMVTFYYPGANHYQPYIEPEVVFMEYLH